MCDLDCKQVSDPSGDLIGLGNSFCLSITGVGMQHLSRGVEINVWREGAERDRPFFGVAYFPNHAFFTLHHIIFLFILMLLSKATSNRCIQP